VAVGIGLDHRGDTRDAAEPLGKPGASPLLVGVYCDIDAFCHRKRVRISIGLRQQVAQLLDFRSELRSRRAACANEAVRVFHRALERIRVVHAEPDRRVRLLHRFWLHRHLS